MDQYPGPYYTVSWRLALGKCLLLLHTQHKSNVSDPNRFSENPSIRTNPPYLAGDRFAEKALSLVDSNTLQPTLENIQFWGIMSCLEYGRASGSK
jgi:hypothetical protein